ncbi:MAG TPA: hypothetical protein VGE74_09530 [Gemmata sp.]
MATDPLQGGPTPSPNPGADPVHTLAPKAPGQPSHDDHDTSGPPSEETIRRGYEEDVYDTKTVLSVPALVVFFFVVAFGTVTVLFSIFSKPPANPGAHPQAEARNKADVNTRMARLGRGKEVDQPRLEPLRLRSGDARAITRPEVTDKGVNSPEYHPEDLLPDPKKEMFAPLYTTAKDRVGIEKTMALDDAALKTLFKSAAPPLAEDASVHAVTGSNAGRGAGGALAVSPPFAEPKKDAPAPAPKETPKKDPGPSPKGGKP